MTSPPTSADLSRADGYPDTSVRDHASGAVGLCLWRMGYEEALGVAQQALANGDVPHFVKPVRHPYPTDDQWQRMCALGLFILSVPNAVEAADADDAVIIDAMRDALRFRDVDLAAQAAAPRIVPMTNPQPSARHKIQRTPEERQELLRAMYEQGTDEGLR